MSRGQERQQPGTLCILSRIPGVFWDCSHRSEARSQGWWGLSWRNLSPLCLYGGTGATPGSIPPRCRADAAGPHKVDVSQGCRGDAQAGWSPWQRCPCPVGLGELRGGSDQWHNRRANAAAPAAAAAPSRK